MKRRGFLGLLGLAPAVPLIAKELAKPVPVAPPIAPSPHDMDRQWTSPSVRYESEEQFQSSATAYDALMFTASYTAVSPTKIDLGPKG